MSLADLGRRAVACKHWRWMNGMYALAHEPGCDGPCCENMPRRAWRFPAVIPSPRCVPDLTDPATLGCLLALVREAWRCQVACAEYDAYDKRPWSVYGSSCWFNGDSEAEALVAALEAAP